MHSRKRVHKSLTAMILCTIQWEYRIDVSWVSFMCVCAFACSHVYNTPATIIVHILSLFSLSFMQNNLPRLHLCPCICGSGHALLRLHSRYVTAIYYHRISKFSEFRPPINHCRIVLFLCCCISFGFSLFNVSYNVHCICSLLFFTIIWTSFSVRISNLRFQFTVWSLKIKLI